LFEFFYINEINQIIFHQDGYAVVIASNL